MYGRLLSSAGAQNRHCGNWKECGELPKLALQTVITAVYLLFPFLCTAQTSRPICVIGSKGYCCQGEPSVCDFGQYLSPGSSLVPLSFIALTREESEVGGRE